MSGLIVSRAALIRTLAGVLAIAALVALSALAPSAAHATGCENSWTNTSGGSWGTATNWSKKAVPANGEEVCITEAGTYTVELNGLTVEPKTLTVGATSGTQTLGVASTCGNNVSLSTTNGLSIGAHGVVSMTNVEGCGNNATITGSISNAGTLKTEQAHGGSRTIQGSLANSGTFEVNTPTTYNGTKAALTNTGAIDVATGVALSVSAEGSVSNGTGGSIVGTGSGDVVMGSKTSFKEGAGTTSGTLPVIVDDASLAYEGSGESTIAIRGESSTLSGSSSAKQALLVQSTCGEHVKVTISGTFTNGGSLTMTNGDGCGNNATVVGSVSNTGTLTSEKAIGGSRTIQGSLANSGALHINTPTSYSATKAALTNTGAIDVATEVSLSVSAEGSVTNGTGGSIVGTGSGDVVMGSGTAFKEGAGTTSGSLPVIVDDASLAYEGSGESTIAIRGEGASLSGSSSAKQALLVQSTCGEHVKVTIGGTFTNGGSLTMTNGDGCGNNATLVGSLSNTGTITSEPAHGGTRSIEGALSNSGALDVNANTSYNGTSVTLTNTGAITIAEGITVTVAGGDTVVNGTGGSISGGTSGVLLVSKGGTFDEGAGTTTGTAPVALDDAALNYEGTGASTIAVHGETSTISGSTAAKQTLAIASTCSENAKLTLSAPLTNSGSITLTNGDGCGDSATLVVTGGTLDNAGTITTEPAHGGKRQIEGNLLNTGTLQVNANTGFEATGAALTNEGAINIANGVTLSVAGGGTVGNIAGTIAGGTSGALSQSKGTFDEGTGKTTGTLPVVLDDAALNYTGKGTSTIALRGEGSTLSGTINAGQTLSVQSTCSEHAAPKAAGFLNSGTILMTNGDGCGNNVTLRLGGETLQNKGTIKVEEPHGGTRTVEGALKQEKTLQLGPGAPDLKVTGTYTQPKTGALKVYVNSASSFGVLTVSAAATLGGNLQLVQMKGFFATAGQKYAVLTAPSVSGAFVKETGGVVHAKGAVGLYYLPTYPAGGVTLAVTQAAVAFSPPAEAAPGATVTITATSLPPSDTIKPSFTDSKKTKTTFANATTTAGGELHVEEVIPLTAAEGTGKFTLGSTEISGLTINENYKVT